MTEKINEKYRQNVLCNWKNYYYVNKELILYHTKKVTLDMLLLNQAYTLQES